MKLSNYLPAIVLGLCLVGPVGAQTGKPWRARAVLEATTPGLFQTVVPPELVHQTNAQMDDSKDFVLMGPDGRPRAFELFWRDPVDPVRLELTPTNVQLSPDRGFVWEADVPEDMVVETLDITLAHKNTIGRIDVFGFRDGSWSQLVRDAAVFRTGGVRQARIDLPQNRSVKLRLQLAGYSRSTDKILSPLQSVWITGRRKGVDYAKQTIPLDWRRGEINDTSFVEIVLPGKGLWIDTLTLETESPFIGKWEAGFEKIAQSARFYSTLQKGESNRVSAMPDKLSMTIGRTWPTRSLLVRLQSGDHQTVTVTSVTAAVRLPRLIFAADKPGRYTAISGTGHSAAVLNHSGQKPGDPIEHLAFAKPETNPDLRLATLVEKYKLKGGPFTREGYTWKAPMAVATPGYYRLVLNRAASLDPGTLFIRIVKDGLQVPYLAGRPTDQFIALKSESTYDASQNSTAWILSLPQASRNWKTVTLSASGIFTRELVVQTPKSGTKTWANWRTMRWENRDNQQTGLRIGLRGLPAGTEQLRLVMHHGDNQPVEITSLTAAYIAPSFYFLAHEAGDYLVFGGNPKARDPQYDLSLIGDALFSALPAPIEMGDIRSIDAGGNWTEQISGVFSEKGWGLYAVLGLVTLGLLVVIVRLFPKADA